VFFFDDFPFGPKRGLSPHTIRNYRDTLVLLLQFMAATLGAVSEHLTIREHHPRTRVAPVPEVSRDRSQERDCHTQRPLGLDPRVRPLPRQPPIPISSDLQRVKLGCRSSTAPATSPIEYLSEPRMDAAAKEYRIAEAPWGGVITHFRWMFNTGARVQEVLNLRRRDARLDALARAA